MRIHLGHPKYTIPIQKKLSKSRLSDPFFWWFLVISELGSRIYIVKSAILSFECFFRFFLHEITLSAIDIDNIGCLEPFLPPWEHFWNRVSVQLYCASDLTLRHIWFCTLRSFLNTQNPKHSDVKLTVDLHIYIQYKLHMRVMISSYSNIQISVLYHQCEMISKLFKIDWKVKL